MSLLLFLLLFGINKCTVVHLEESEFEDLASSGMWYLEFYAPWCGHCKKFAPIYEEASNLAELSSINFAAIDATAEKQLAEQFDVHRFPTIKFWENGITYDYTGQRSIDSLTQYGLRMIEPVIKAFDLQLWMKHRSRYSVSFLFIDNDNDNSTKMNAESVSESDSNSVSDSAVIKTKPNTNTNNYNHLYESMMTYFRPNVPMFYIKWSEFKALLLTLNPKQNKELQNALQLNPLQYQKLITEPENDDNDHNNEDALPPSVILAMTPSKPHSTVYYGEHTGEQEMFSTMNFVAFIEQNQYPSIMELQLGNYRKLITRCKFFGLLMIDADKEQESEQFVSEMEALMLSHSEWNSDSIREYQKWRDTQLLTDDTFDENKYNFENADRKVVPFMYKFIVAMVNYSRFEDWSNHLFSINDKSNLPQLIIYDPIQDGYYMSPDIDATFVGSILSFDDRNCDSKGEDDEENGSLEMRDQNGNQIQMTYTKGFFTRQTMKLERFLNRLRGWQIAVLFIGVFVFLCLLMIGLDYCCTPDMKTHSL